MWAPAPKPRGAHLALGLFYFQFAPNRRPILGAQIGPLSHLSIGLFNRSAHSAVPNLDDLMTGCLDALRIGLRIRRIGRIGRIGRSGRLDRLVGLRGLGGLIGLDGFGGSGGLGGLDENRWKSLIIYENQTEALKIDENQ